MCVQDLKARGTPFPVLGSHILAIVPWGLNAGGGACSRCIYHGGRQCSSDLREISVSSAEKGSAGSRVLNRRVPTARFLCFQASESSLRMRPSGRDCSPETYWPKARAAAQSCQQSFSTSTKAAFYSPSSHAPTVHSQACQLSQMVYCAVGLGKGTVGVTTAVTRQLHDRTGLQEAGPHRPCFSLSSIPHKVTSD